MNREELEKKVLANKVKQTDGIRLILKWVDACPMECEISSMQGSIIHIKVSSLMKKEESTTS